MQTGLIGCIIEALGFKDTNACRTPAKVAALRKDLDGKRDSKAFNYMSVIGMILYLSSHI
eukprot:1859558-Ditylum_brightwellii.AAC.1